MVQILHKNERSIDYIYEIVKKLGFFVNIAQKHGNLKEN